VSIGDWDIFGDLTRLRQHLGRLSHGSDAGMTGDERDDAWAPPVDIIEQEGALVLLVDLPGVRREDIELTVADESVTVAGQRSSSEGGSGIRQERPVGRFRRSFRMAMPVDPSRAQAVYRDGVLRITVPHAGSAGPARVRVRVE
jgi:HSP20 family protein